MPTGNNLERNAVGADRHRKSAEVRMRGSAKRTTATDCLNIVVMHLGSSVFLL